MREFKHETIIISKEAWKFMWNFERKAGGFKPCPEEQLDRIWERIVCRNNGANPKTHPISENEIRVDKDSFNARFEAVVKTLTENGYEYRQDGFIATGAYL